MKMQFVFGNPTRKKSSAKRKMPIKFRRGKTTKGSMTTKNPEEKPISLREYVAKLKKKTKLRSSKKEEKEENKENVMAAKKAKKKVAKKKVAKKVAKKKVAKKVAKKAHKKKAHKKVVRKHKKVAKKAHKKVVRKHRRKVAKKAHKKVVRKHRRKSKLGKVSKAQRKAMKALKGRLKAKHSLAKAANPVRKHRKKHKKKSHSIMKTLNPFSGGSMASKFETYTGHSLPEAGGLALGGVLYGATNSLMAKTPVLKTIHAQLVKVPVVGSALPTLLAGAILNMIGEKKKIKALSMIGKGLVGASVVGIGVNASQKIPGLAGVDYTMAGEAQLGYGDEADFGQSEADFGELIDYNTESLSGVDYTMSGVDYTMSGYGDEADFGELIEENTEALSGQLG